MYLSARVVVARTVVCGYAARPDCADVGLRSSVGGGAVLYSFLVDYAHVIMLRKYVWVQGQGDD